MSKKFSFVIHIWPFCVIFKFFYPKITRSSASQTTTKTKKNPDLKKRKKSFKIMKTVSKGSKFNVGERVLCYEPDLTKARVVYDAKILKIECPETRSRSAKNSSVEFHYLVHFQGWSSTWDRYVTEEFLLKTTENNRALQKKLFREAEAARR